jgi:hypothetical protein
MELLVKRLVDSGFVALLEAQHTSIVTLGVRTDPLKLVATEKGRSYYASLGLETSDWNENDA